MKSFSCLAFAQLALLFSQRHSRGEREKRAPIVGAIARSHSMMAKDLEGGSSADVDEPVLCPESRRARRESTLCGKSHLPAKSNERIR